MSKRTTPRAVLVTGANKGIGLAIVNAILDTQDDVLVLLGSRDPERGRAAKQEIANQDSARAERVEVVSLDVADDASVTSAAQSVRQRLAAAESRLVGVVNNAGIGARSDRKSVLDVNTRGIRRVCDAFVPMLEPESGRVVNVTSASGPTFVAKCSERRRRFFVDDQIEWSTLDAFMNECAEWAEGTFADEGLADGDAYGLSKACANTLTRMLAREHAALQINACTPGFIETDMTRPYAERSGRAPAEMGMRPPAEGTRAPMFLLFGKVEGSGGYFGSDGVRSPWDRYRSPGAPPYEGD